MSGGPRFPKQPLADRERAFVGPDGKNPFGEAQAVPSAPSSAVSENIFSPARSLGSPADRQLYEPILPHRAGSVFWLGLLGMGGAALGILVLGPILWLLMAGLRNLSLIVVTGAMLVCVVAVYMGSVDLKAIRAGAMDPSGERRTILGQRFGILGLLMGASAWSFLVYSIFAALL